MSDRLEVRGDQRLTRTLAAASADMGDLTEVNTQVGDYLAGRARTAAPKVSGHLASTIYATADPTGPTVHADAAYAGPINYGWPARNIAANPFLTDPIDTEAALIVRRYEDATGRAVAQVKGV